MYYKLIQLSSLSLAITTLAFVSNSFSQTNVMSLATNGYCEQAAELGAACKDNWASIILFTKSVDEATKNKTLANIDCDKIGPAYAVAEQILRDAQALKNMREPAGVDWQHRGKYCSDKLKHAAALLKSMPAGAKVVEAAEKYKSRSMDKRAKAVAKVRQLFDKNNLAKAESDFDEILQEVDQFVIWLSTASGRQVLGQVDGMRRQLAGSTKDLREAEATAALAAALNSHPPQINELLEAAKATITAVGTGRSASIDGQSYSGPEALKAIFNKWQTTHSNLIRTMGVHGLGQGLNLGTTPEQSFASQLGTTTFADTITKLNAQMTEILPTIISVDLKQTTDADAKENYVGYLRTLGLMANRVPNELLAALEKELAVMEMRPDLGNAIKNYQAATDDLLLWRNRAAISAKKSVKPSLELVEATKSLSKQTYIPSLVEGLDQIATGLDKSAVGFETHVNNVQALTGNAAFGNYRDRVWATVRGEINIGPELTSLRNDLYIGKGSPPLSVAAAKSFATASRKNFTAVGGPISSAQVEALGSRFPKLSDSMNSLVPLDACPSENSQIGDMLLRFNVTPRWVLHEHFFKKIPTE